MNQLFTRPRSRVSGRSPIIVVINVLVLLASLCVTGFAWLLINKPSVIGYLGRHTHLPQSQQWAAQDALRSSSLQLPASSI
jgi:hypothetical protein